MKITIHLVISLWLSLSVSGQKLLLTSDSLPLLRKSIFTHSYTTNHPKLGDCKIITSNPSPVEKMPKRFPGDVGGGALTLFTGIGTGSSIGTLVRFENQLKFTDENYNLQVHLFSHAEVSKTRERVTNSDGSKSVSTSKSIRVNWTWGGHGMILEKGDTVGIFKLATYLLDSASEHLVTRINDESPWVYAALKRYEMPSSGTAPGPDLQVNGYYRGVAFWIVSSGANNRSLFLERDESKAIFQRDANFIMHKKDRIRPYLLVDASLTDEQRLNMVRMAMLARLIQLSVSTVGW